VFAGNSLYFNMFNLSG